MNSTTIASSGIAKRRSTMSPRRSARLNNARPFPTTSPRRSTMGQLRSARLSKASALNGDESFEKIYSVDHLASMLDVELTMDDGSPFIVDDIVYSICPAVYAVFQDNMRGKCAIVFKDAPEKRADIMEMYKMLGVADAEMSSIRLQVSDNQYNMIITPTVYGENLFDVGEKRLIVRAVEMILDLGLNPLGDYDGDETEALFNLIDNIMFTAVYFRECDGISFTSPGTMVPIRNEHRAATLSLAKRLIDQMYFEATA